MIPYVHTFLAGAIGACIPDLLRSRRAAWRGRLMSWNYLLLRVSFPLLAGYLAVFVFECQSPLHALGLGLILDELLMMVRSVGITHMSALVTRVLGVLRTESLTSDRGGDSPPSQPRRSNKKSHRL